MTNRNPRGGQRRNFALACLILLTTLQAGACKPKAESEVAQIAAELESKSVLPHLESYAEAAGLLAGAQELIDDLRDVQRALTLMESVPTGRDIVAGLDLSELKQALDDLLAHTAELEAFEKSVGPLAAYHGELTAALDTAKAKPSEETLRALRAELRRGVELLTPVASVLGRANLVLVALRALTKSLTTKIADCGEGASLARKLLCRPISEFGELLSGVVDGGPGARISELNAQVGSDIECLREQGKPAAP